MPSVITTITTTTRNFPLNEKEKCEEDVASKITIS
jgi:hypothetical protein